VSRNLYTIAVVTQEVVAKLRRLHASDPDGWWTGVGERELLEFLAEPRPCVAFYQVILDGWSRALDDLASLCSPMQGDRMQPLCRQLDATGLCVVEHAPEAPLAPPCAAQSANAYAVRAMAAALNTAFDFMRSTDLPLVIVHRTLYRSFDDDEFGGVAPLIDRQG
jgi:hypothetical protein